MTDGESVFSVEEYKKGRGLEACWQKEMLG